MNRPLALLATLAALLSGCRQQTAEQGRQEPATIELSGGILGVTLGMILEEAHEKLDRLKKDSTTAPDDEHVNQEREAGERAVWMLNGTEFQWIIAWANNSGRIFKLSSSLRADQLKPFTKIGDLAHTTGGDNATAVWDVSRPDGWSYRLVAKGRQQEANIIYLYAVSQRAQ